MTAKNLKLKLTNRVNYKRMIASFWYYVNYMIFGQMSTKCISDIMWVIYLVKWIQNIVYMSMRQPNNAQNKDICKYQIKSFILFHWVVNL